MGNTIIILNNFSNLTKAVKGDMTENVQEKMQRLNIKNVFLLKRLAQHETPREA